MLCVDAYVRVCLSVLDRTSMRVFISSLVQ